MTIATAIASICVFMWSFRLFGVTQVGTDVLRTVQGAVATLRDGALDDETREKKVQHASLLLLAAFVSILMRSAISLLAAFLPIWLSSAIGFTTIEDVTRYLSRWEVIVVATAAIAAGSVLWSRLRPSRLVIPR